MKDKEFILFASKIFTNSNINWMTRSQLKRFKSSYNKRVIIKVKKHNDDIGNIV